MLGVPRCLLEKGLRLGARLPQDLCGNVKGREMVSAASAAQRAVASPGTMRQGHSPVTITAVGCEGLGGSAWSRSLPWLQETPAALCARPVSFS